MLAKASAVKLGATPRPFKKDTHCTDNKQTLRALRTVSRATARRHSYIPTFLRTYVHSYIHAFIVAILGFKLVALACPRLRDVLALASCGRPSLAHRYGGYEDETVDTLLFSATKEETADYCGGTGTRVSMVYLPVFLSSFLTLFVVSGL